MKNHNRFNSFCLYFSSISYLITITDLLNNPFCNDLSHNFFFWHLNTHPIYWSRHRQVPIWTGTKRKWKFPPTSLWLVNFWNFSTTTVTCFRQFVSPYKRNLSFKFIIKGTNVKATWNKMSFIVILFFFFKQTYHLENTPVQTVENWWLSGATCLIICRLLFQWASTIEIQLSVLV